MQIKRSASANNCYIVLLLYLLNSKRFAGEEYLERRKYMSVHTL